MKRTPNLIHRRRALMAAGLLALTALVWTGCDSFLETDPLGEPTSASFFDTPAQAEQATNATYGMLRSWSTHVFAWLGMTDIVSDDADKGSTPPDASFLAELDNLNFAASNNAFRDVWNGYYQGIFRANTAIRGIQEMDNISEVRAQQLVAENRFLRAYYYFFLVRAFGGVPLITEPLAPEEYDQQRATREEVYAQIEEDLQFAAENLPSRSEYDLSDLGRATSGAARAFLAEAKLYQEEYAEACSIGQSIIQSGEYDLYPVYSEIFTPPGENSVESVFEVQTVAVEEQTGGTQFSQVQGVRGFPNLGWGFNQPTADLVAAYEPGDPRLEATVLFPWELLPYGNPENLVVWVNPQTPSDRYNQKAFLPPDNPGGSGNGGVNIRRLRYAYVLLNTAEACFHAGDEAAARQYVNEVRERARDREVTLGFTPETLAEDIADVIGLEEGTSRVFVRHVRGDSWAAGELRGLEADRFDYDGDFVPVCVEQMDLIASVDGVDVTTLASYHEALAALSPGETATVEVLRVSQPTCGTPGEAEVDREIVRLEARRLLPAITASGQELLEAIWHERRVEVAMEQHRWFDIIRQGRAEQVMADVGKDFVPGKHENFPIPQSEVEIAGLQQNPGY